MEITINDNRKIFAVQKEFSKEFPYLKLEFFSKPHKPGGSSSKKLIKHPGKTLGECRAIQKSGVLTVSRQMTVLELEQEFMDVFDLTIQVFRKAGKNWIETASTDGWTLDKENKTGAEMEKPLSEEISFGNPPMVEER
jgi:hypothetical protein